MNKVLNPLWLKSTVLLKYFFPDVIWVPNRSNVVQKMNPPLIRPLVKKILAWPNSSMHAITSMMDVPQCN